MFEVMALIVVFATEPLKQTWQVSPKQLDVFSDVLLRNDYNMRRAPCCIRMAPSIDNNASSPSQLFLVSQPSRLLPTQVKEMVCYCQNLRLASPVQYLRLRVGRHSKYPYGLCSLGFLSHFLDPRLKPIR